MIRKHACPRTQRASRMTHVILRKKEKDNLLCVGFVINPALCQFITTSASTLPVEHLIWGSCVGTDQCHWRFRAPPEASAASSKGRLPPEAELARER